MPDGQELGVVVTARTRTPDGAWWYECEAILPTRYQHPDGATEPKAAPTPISVAAEHIAPIPGEDYTPVPTDGAVAGRQWLLARIRMQTPRGPEWRLHRRDCWQATGEQKRITTREALKLAGAGGIEACDVCRPDRALLSAR